MNYLKPKTRAVLFYLRVINALLVDPEEYELLETQLERYEVILEKWIDKLYHKNYSVEKSVKIINRARRSCAIYNYIRIVK